MYVIQITLPMYLQAQFGKEFTAQFENYTPFYAECIIPRLDPTRVQLQVTVPNILNIRDLKAINAYIKLLAPTTSTITYWAVDGRVLDF